MYVWANPRWEDYDYVHADEMRGNPLRWLGNGFVRDQVNGKKTTHYLDHATVPVQDPLAVENGVGLPSF
jgi:hypothetical protein